MKLFAAAVIVAAGYYFGSAAASPRAQAYERAAGLLRLINELHDAITYSRADLFGVFSRFSDPALEKCGFLTALREGAPVVRTAWERACLTLGEGVPMFDEICTLGAKLGMTDAAAQGAMLTSLVERMSPQVESMGRELRAKAGSYRVLGALAGCLAAIILY